jgi:hypothetical protein
MSPETTNAPAATEASHTELAIGPLSVAADSTALVDEVRAAPGFSDLKPQLQLDLVRMLESDACDPEARQIQGGWQAVAGVLGTKERQSFARLQIWREAGLIGWNTGPRNVYSDDRRQVFEPGSFPVLPTETTPSTDAERLIELNRRRAADAPQTQTADAPQTTRARAGWKALSLRENPKYVKDVVVATTSQPSQEQIEKADAVVAALVRRHGKIHKSDLLRESLLEDKLGVRACYEHALERSREPSPVGLLMRMLENGEHRNRDYTPQSTTCVACGQSKPDVVARQNGQLRCDSCAENAIVRAQNCGCVETLAGPRWCSEHEHGTT